MGIQLCTHRKVSSYTTTLNALLMWYKIFSSINVIVLNIGRSSFDHNNTISVFQYRFSFWTEINRYIGLMAMRYQAYFGSKYRPISSNIGSSFNYVKKKKTNSTGQLMYLMTHIYEKEIELWLDQQSCAPFIYHSLIMRSDCELRRTTTLCIEFFFFCILKVCYSMGMS